MAVSPTGHNPIFLWSAAQQDVWAAMQASNHPWMVALISKANASGTSGSAYLDLGQWSTLAYQITGTASYAQQALNLILPYLARDPVTTTIDTLYGTGNGNFIRAWGLQYPIWLDWLTPAMTAAQQQAAFAGLHKWCDYCLAINTPTYTGGFRLGDSDQLIGQYFTLALTDLLTGSAYLAKTQTINWLGRYETNLPVGGLDATAADFTTIRNRIRQFVTEYAAGGEWFVSSEYNLSDDVQLMILGSQAVKTATGTDHFPEFTALLPALAAQAPYEHTPALEQPYSWGDDEHPRDNSWFWNVTYLGMMAGLVPNDPWISGTVKAIVAGSIPLSSYGSGLANVFYFYDPSKGPATATLPNGANYCSGNACMRWIDSTHLFGCTFMTPKGDTDLGSIIAGNGQPYPIGMIDHEVSWFRNYQLWVTDEWAITHPIVYGTVNFTGERADYVNSMMLAGLGTIPNRTVLASGSGMWGCYVTGQMKGSPYQSASYNPPPEFLHNWTSTVAYLSPGVVVVKDHVNMDDPQKLGNFASYSTADKTNIQSALAIMQWIQHCPVAPTVSGNTVSWATPKGKAITCQFLSPSAINVQSFDETTLGANFNPVPASEKKWQFRVLSNGNAIPGSTAAQDDFLCVISVGTPPTTKLNADGSLDVGATHVVFNADGTVIVTGAAPPPPVAMMTQTKYTETKNSDGTVTFS